MHKVFIFCIQNCGNHINNVEIRTAKSEITKSEINKNKNHKNNKKQSYEEIFIGAGLVAAYRARQLCAEKVLCLRRSFLQPGEPV